MKEERDDDLDEDQGSVLSLIKTGRGRLKAAARSRSPSKPGRFIKRYTHITETLAIEAAGRMGRALWDG